jgi:xylulokinase
MRAHAERFGMPSPPKRIIATGGASANNCILSSIASIFGCDVYTVQRQGKQKLAISACEIISDVKISLTHLCACY